jgi:RNA polymerase sigma factor (sigma-70 family)
MSSLPPDPRHLSDEDKALIDWIVASRPGWQTAYERFFHHLCGPVLKDAIEQAEKRYQVDFPLEVVANRLFINMLGKDKNWSGLKSWRPEKSPFKQWLWVVVRNICRRLLRERHPPEAVGAVDQEAIDSRKPHPGPSAEDVVAFNELLDKLGDDCGQLLRLKYFHGLTDEDIGRLRSTGREWANRQRRDCERRLAELMRQEGLNPSDFNFGPPDA